MAKKKEISAIDETLVKYQILRKRGLRLTYDKKIDKKMMSKYIMFVGGEYNTNDPEIMAFLDNHPSCLNSEANKNHPKGNLASFGRYEDIKTLSPGEAKRLMGTIDNLENENADLLDKLEKSEKKIKSQQQTIRRRDDKLKDMGGTIDPDDEDYDDDNL